jgi:glycosyltransferase involved in cell wall biosynthesis
MNCELPHISVITPTYNRRHLLPRTWQSLKTQSEQDFQWIIVDDGSTDDTGDYVESLNDPRIHYIYQDNQGCNAARKRGELEVKAPFVCFLDSDDELYDGGTLETMLAAIESTPYDIGVACFTVVAPDGGGGESRFEHDDMVLSYEDLICGCKVSGEVFRIFKKEALDVAPWPAELRGNLGLRYYEIAKAFRFQFINRPALIYHMNHGQNLTSAKSSIERAESMAKGYLELIKRHKLAWLKWCPSQYGIHLFFAGLYTALNGDAPAALRLATLSMLNHGPFMNCLGLLFSLLLPLPIRRQLFVLRSGLKGRT